MIGGEQDGVSRTGWTQGWVGACNELPLSWGYSLRQVGNRCEALGINGWKAEGGSPHVELEHLVESKNRKDASMALCMGYRSFILLRLTPRAAIDESGM